MFSVDLGLSSSLITQVYQDSKGIIWVATQDGLNKYDGSKLTVYKHDEANPNSILNNFIRVLFEDRQGHLLIGYSDGLQFYDHATDSFRQIPLVLNSGEIIGARAICIAQRQNGEVLIGTAGYGLFSLKFEHTELTAKRIRQQIPALTIKSLLEDKEQNLWVGSPEGLFRIGRNGKIKNFSGSGNMHLNTISSMCQDKEGNVYVSSLSNGLFVHRKATDDFSHIPYPASPQLAISALHLGNKDVLYLGTDGEGVKIYDLKKKVITEGEFNVEIFDFRKAKVHSIQEDRAGNLWLGIYQKGLMLLPASAGNFKYIGYKSINKNFIGSNAILSILEDHKGTLWVGTDGDGLYGIGLNGEQKAHFSRTSDPASVSSSIMSIYEDSDKNLWLGSYLHGLAKLNRQTGNCDYMPAIRDENAKPVEAIYDIVEDRQKTLWVASMGAGLFSIDLPTQKVTHYYAPPGSENASIKNFPPNRWINCLLLTSKDKLYMGTHNGIGCLDLRTKDFFSTHNTNRLLLGRAVYALYEDQKGNIWIGTSKGLVYLDINTNEIQEYNMDNGLPSNVICAIKGDEAGNIWISTTYGISKLMPGSNSFVNYYATDGLQGSEFSKGAAFVNDRKKIFFGGINGITYFNPEQVSDVIFESGKKLNARITGFYIHNQVAVKKGMKSGKYDIVDEAVMDAKNFHLSHNDNSFSIELATMNFANSERITYQYALKDENWISLTPGTKTVHFTNLAPGTYRFRFRAKNLNQYSDVKEVSIIISSAWYFSDLAKVVYALVLFTVLVLVVLQIRHRLHTRQKLREHMQAKQINDAKLQFFINIAHEIRTPMTLIISPLKKLMSTDKDQERQKSYATMHRNSNRILHLINQLMDLRKIDKGQMQLKFQDTDIVEFIEELCSIFDEQTKTKNIRLNFHHQMDRLPVWIDPTNLDKSILNVLSNAFKFTPENGTINIYLQTGEDENAVNELRHYFEIIISDSGIGIAESEQEKIFECFYQVRSAKNHFVQGTGIGLNLTRSIVELHHGSIRAENNKDGRGCRFIMRLPLGKEHLKAEEVEQPSSLVQKVLPAAPVLPTLADETESVKVKPKNKSRVLVVDDDDEIRKYICQELSSEYHIMESSNGKEALALLLTDIPDLIISDVMMPEMDGITLCRKIKQNVTVNHVPVILLTAKSEDEDNLQGLGIGADAYMVKPFNIEILKSTVRNIIRNREMLKNNFSGNQHQHEKVQRIEIKSSDEKLLNKLLEIIIANIGNSTLSVEMIANEVGISRVHLHRKIKELTNQSPSEFIRNIRLQKAADILSSKHINVSEVAFAVGFSSLPYFSTTFKELYGVSPTAYMESHLNQVEKTGVG